MNRYLRIYFLSGILILALAITFLFFVKTKVLELSKNIKSVNNQILLERENIHVLKAEYSYLTNPKRLKNLADKYLNLRAPVNGQLMNYKQALSFLNDFKESNDLTSSDIGPKRELQVMEKVD